MYKLSTVMNSAHPRAYYQKARVVTGDLINEPSVLSNTGRQLLRVLHFVWIVDFISFWARSVSSRLLPRRPPLTGLEGRSSCRPPHPGPARPAPPWLSKCPVLDSIPPSGSSPVQMGRTSPGRDEAVKQEVPSAVEPEII